MMPTIVSTSVAYEEGLIDRRKSINGDVGNGDCISDSKSSLSSDCLVTSESKSSCNAYAFDDV
jgi:hypothetical protein